MSDAYVQISLITAFLLLSAALAALHRRSLRIREELKRNDGLFKEAEGYRSLFEQTDEGIIHTDMNGRFVFLNRAAAKIFGYDGPEDLYDEGINSIQFYADPSIADSIREQLRSGRPIHNQVVRVKSRDGRLIHIMVSIHARFDAGGNPVGLESIGYDVTDRVMLEAELAKYSDNLEEIVRKKTDEVLRLERIKFDLEKLAAVGETVSTLVQSLADPLSVIRDTFGYISRNVDFNADERRMLELGHKEGLRIERLISESLDFTRPEDLRPIVQDVRPILDQAAGWHEEECRKKGITLRSEYASGLPRVSVDLDRFSQVIGNLLQNAVESVRDGEGRIVLKTEYSPGDPDLRISVEDNGSGISVEDMDRLFDPFFTRKPEGTGLGLPVVQKIVKAHHGTLAIESLPGEGTRVRIGLPVGPAPAKPGPV
jgi:PAS domain S-box-containing protein